MLEFYDDNIVEYGDADILENRVRLDLSDMKAGYKDVSVPAIEIVNSPEPNPETGDYDTWFLIAGSIYITKDRLSDGLGAIGTEQKFGGGNHRKWFIVDAVKGYWGIEAQWGMWGIAEVIKDMCKPHGVSCEIVGDGQAILKYSGDDFNIEQCIDRIIKWWL